MIVALAERVPLGRSTLTVSRIGIGTAALALPYGPPGVERGAPSRDEAVAVVRGALDAGVTLVDTAPAYADAETLVGRATHRRPEVTVATKVTPPATTRRYRLRAALRVSVEDSLLRMRRERIDLLQVHNATAQMARCRPLTSELVALRDEGLVASIGATVYDEESALAVIESDDFECVQIPYSALDRRPERRVLPRAQERGCGVLVRSVLMRGLLSPSARSLPDRWRPVRAAVDDFRRDIGASWEELPAAALGFAASAPGVTCALTGPRDEVELRRLIADAERFEDAAAAVRGKPARQLEAAFLDPRVWPTLGTGTTL